MICGRFVTRSNRHRTNTKFARRSVRFHLLWTVRERGENSRTLDRTVDQIRELAGRKCHRGIGCIALARCRLFDKKKIKVWRNRKTAREQKEKKKRTTEKEWKNRNVNTVFFTIILTNLSFRCSFLDHWMLRKYSHRPTDKRTVYISVDHVFHVYTNVLTRTARDNCSRRKKYLLSQRQIREAFTLNDFPLAIYYFNWPNRWILRCRASFYTISRLRTIPCFYQRDDVVMELQWRKQRKRASPSKTLRVNRSSYIRDNRAENVHYDGTLRAWLDSLSFLQVLFILTRYCL